MNYQFDDYDLKRFLTVASAFGQSRYGYVVTPNADHLIRLADSADFQSLYAHASYILMDSQFLSYWLWLTRGTRLSVCTGSDLTEALFDQVITPDDPLVVIGGTDHQLTHVTKHYGLKRVAHLNPPMGFINRPAEVDECVRFIESHSPFRFCLICVGSPQQEILAHRLAENGVARGLSLCVGASLDFISGGQMRAPVWMRRLGLEWLFRLLQNPRRMARRYLVRGPRVFGLLRRASVEIRPAPEAISGTNP